jgi:hypothetical protein
MLLSCLLPYTTSAHFIRPGAGWVFDLQWKIWQSIIVLHARYKSVGWNCELLKNFCCDLKKKPTWIRKSSPQTTWTPDVSHETIINQAAGFLAINDLEDRLWCCKGPKGRRKVVVPANENNKRWAGKEGDSQLWHNRLVGESFISLQSLLCAARLANFWEPEQYLPALLALQVHLSCWIRTILRCWDGGKKDPVSTERAFNALRIMIIMQHILKLSRQVTQERRERHGFKVGIDFCKVLGPLTYGNDA